MLPINFFSNTKFSSFLNQLSRKSRSIFPFSPWPMMIYVFALTPFFSFAFPILSKSRKISSCFPNPISAPLPVHMAQIFPIMIAEKLLDSTCVCSCLFFVKNCVLLKAALAETRVSTQIRPIVVLWVSGFCGASFSAQFYSTIQLTKDDLFLEDEDWTQKKSKEGKTPSFIFLKT